MTDKTSGPASPVASGTPAKIERIPAGDDVFANPWIACTNCNGQVTHVTSPPLTNQPCGHRASTITLCPSWSPADGCTCAELEIIHDAPEVSR
ncbi:hypothetical protein [Saccharothrix stipae]